MIIYTLQCIAEARHPEIAYPTQNSARVRVCLPKEVTTDVTWLWAIVGVIVFVINYAYLVRCSVAQIEQWKREVTRNSPTAKDS